MSIKSVHLPLPSPSPSTPRTKANTNQKIQLGNAHPDHPSLLRPPTQRNHPRLLTRPHLPRPLLPLKLPRTHSLLRLFSLRNPAPHKPPHRLPPSHHHHYQLHKRTNQQQPRHILCSTSDPHPRHTRHHPLARPQRLGRPDPTRRRRRITRGHAGRGSAADV